MLREWEFQIQLDEQSDKAIYLQIADAIINDIHSGRLKAGDALPGSRNLAQRLKVNRNTIVEALSVLLIEGWLVSRERQGTFVASTLPDFKEAQTATPIAASINDTSSGSTLLQIDDGYPDSKIAPVNELARAYRQIFNQKAKWQLMGYSSEFGNLEFRKAVVQMLNHQRGMRVNEQHICITRGSQMAMYLAAQCLLSKGDYVIIENPGYKPAWEAFDQSGAKLLPAKVDNEGLIIEDVMTYLKLHKNIKAIYVTPHRQYPTTVTLSLKRRLELIKLSNKYGITIIEDDYDNEFHFGYRPTLPLSSFMELKNYVYIGTMSKVVAPALRIGYIASNDYTLIKKVGRLRKIIDVQGDSIMEQAVLQLIKDGTIKRHIKKATNYYKTKRDITEALLKKHLGNKVSYSSPEGGLAYWIVPKKQVDWVLILEKLNMKGFSMISPESYSFDKIFNGMRLGYASLSDQELEDFISALADLF
ncbi:PLP-dependent aminotransferase family protein [Sphingobacterium sp. ML3W]|uniref:MocR-like pyridoxine biosynthesis transcription factor PdxR n=1 Tax=Sphingobacterium sp. ML3W TaxID=1538644 RepID=UPI00249B86D3|nr:PLP-dependent aminotransferase family protein [Sphingobacterium sp. ML3W]WFA82281.1 PLP-dependent aminotransferase family protein [Sphingobacterium sp. ML3W]